MCKKSNIHSQKNQVIQPYLMKFTNLILLILFMLIQFTNGQIITLYCKSSDSRALTIRLKMYRKKSNRKLFCVFCEVKKIWCYYNKIKMQNCIKRNENGGDTRRSFNFCEKKSLLEMAFWGHNINRLLVCGWLVDLS